MIVPVVVPQEDVNSETALLTAWRVAEGAAVKKGQPVCEVETTKMVFEVAAAADGWLVRGAEEKMQVTFNTPIGYIAESPSEMAQAQEQVRSATSAQAPAPSREGDALHKITSGARRLMEEHGLTPAQLPDKPVVTERDIRLLIDENADWFSPIDRKARGAGSGKLQVQRTVILGAGRGAMQVMDILQHDHRVQVIGYLDDDRRLHGETIYGLPILGAVQSAEELYRDQRFDAAIISVSTSNSLRRRWYELLKKLGVPLVNAIDPTAKINRGVLIGEGNVLCAFVHVGVETRIGNNNFISAYNSIDHHNLWGSHITTGPGVVTSSRARVDDDVKMGTGIFIQPGVTIGQGAQIASGAVLTQPVPAGHAAKTRVNVVITPLKG
jgi:sugar O-acyltransferase (sialic acid O-acetyltransferase NeuD family)